MSSAPDPEELPLPVRIGEVVGGKYRVARVIGQGGNGVVYAAKHLQLGHDVALKCLLQYPLRGPEAIPRFQQEARAAVALKSEHIVRVADVGLLSVASRRAARK